MRARKSSSDHAEAEGMGGRGRVGRSAVISGLPVSLERRTCRQARGRQEQPIRRISDEERQEHFGRPGDRDQLRYIRTPWYQQRSRKHIGIWVHRLLVDEVQHAMAHAVRPAWVPLRIDSLSVRRIRGGSDWSLHAYGLAWDFFATPPRVPPPGGVWTPRNGVSTQFGRMWTIHGFTWGADWKRKDVPHIEWAGPPP